MSEGRGHTAEAPGDLWVVRTPPPPPVHLMLYTENTPLPNRAKYVMRYNASDALYGGQWLNGALTPEFSGFLLS